MLVVFALIDSQFNGFRAREFSCLGERWSRPAWARGLKHPGELINCRCASRAPRGRVD